jgi:hypothetical protein
VNTANHTFKVKVRDGSMKELSMNNETEIRVNGQVSTASGLASGMLAEIRYRTDNGLALRINAASRPQPQPQATEIRGVVKNVNVPALQLVVDTKEGKQVMVTINTNTRISKDGKIITLADIAPGAEVKIKLLPSSTGNVALVLEVGR